MTLRTRSSKRPSRMLARNWKHQWLPLCLARLARKTSMGRPLARLMISSLNSRAPWKPANPQDGVWKILYRIIMRTILQERVTIHFNIITWFAIFSMPQTMKIPAAKAAVDKEWEKLEKISASDLTKVRSKSEVIDEARTKGAKVHVASLMDICHLKKAELEAKHQKYRGRVVLRGGIVKDDSGSYAVFTEQGSSALQMTAAIVMDIISRLSGCAGQAADAVSAYTQLKMEDAPKLLKIPQSECPDIWIRLPRHKWPKSCPVWKTQSFLLNGISMVILWQGFFYGKGNFRKSY